MSTPPVDWLELVGKLSEPINKLIETVAQGIGGIYAPVGVVCMAKAEASASIIRAKTEGEVAELKLRVQHRLEYIEGIRQENLERITVYAAGALPDRVADEPVSKDWILRFIRESQDVCDEDMQRVWANILAGEVAKPGSFSRRTLSFLSNLEKEEAEAFTKFSRLAFTEKGWPRVLGLDMMEEQLKSLGIHMGWVSHFESIGLIDSMNGMCDEKSLEGHRFGYFEIECEVIKTREWDADERVLGNFASVVDYTALGNELYKICGAEPIKGYVDVVHQALSKSGSRNLGLKVIRNRNNEEVSTPAQGT
jgi:hypothetical protein